MAYKGKYTVKNPSKYRGKVTDVIFRSLWEYRLMEWCDTNKNVVWWSSEPFPIRYLSPIDGRMHSYWVDFLVKQRLADGTERVRMIEVKPLKETRPPVPPPTRKSRKYLLEVQKWGVNQAKWTAAKKLCATKGWDWVIMTEKQLDF